MLRAQDSIPRFYYLANKLEVNPLQALVNEFSVSYEHCFPNNYAINFGAGFIYSNGPLEHHVSISGFDPDIYLYHGGVARLGFKYYFTLDKNINTYIETKLMYKYEYFENQYQYSNSNLSEFVNVSEISLIAGAELPAIDKFPIEIYAGIGFRDNHGVSITNNFNQSKVNNYSDRSTISENFPTIKLGLRVGIGFNKKCPALNPEDSPNRNYFYSDKISFNPIQTFINEYSISYEHRFSKKIGIEVMGGYIKGDKPGTDESFDNLLSPLTMYHGAVLRTGLKYYLSTHSKDNAYSGYYLECMFMFKRLGYTDLYVATDDDDDYNVQNATRYVGELAYILGKEIGYSHYFFNFYAGLGIRAIYETTTTTAFHSIGDPDQGIPEVPPGVQTSHEMIPMIKLGVKLGFAFNKRYFSAEK